VGDLRPCGLASTSGCQRELNLKLDFAEEGETGEYVLTNTSTWKEWWVVVSG
jgi:hypothetical protein